MLFLRVISGKYKGKKLEGFDMLGTRPTKDRVKESIFATINYKLKDSSFLDLFSGTGSIGIEAISNGAKISYFVDNGKEILKVLNNNLNGIDNAVVVKYDYQEALKYFENNDIKFDIIYIDPPYHLNLLNKSLDLIEKYNLLNQDGIIICEYEEEIPICQYELLKEKRYGKTNVSIYRKK